MMQSDRMDIYARRTVWSDSIELAMCKRRPDGGMDVLQPPAIRRIEPGESFPEPTLRLTPTEGQRLMDELWGCGLRPTEGTGSAGSLAATEKHLADMRAIAMGLLREGGMTPGA